MEYLSSAEILVAGTYAWTAVNPLPQPYWNMRLVSLNNIPYMFGQRSQTYITYLFTVLSTGGQNGADQPTIFKFNTDSSTWDQMGLQMTDRRIAFGISLIEAERVFQWCPSD